MPSLRDPLRAPLLLNLQRGVSTVICHGPPRSGIATQMTRYGGESRSDRGYYMFWSPKRIESCSEGVIIRNDHESQVPM